MADTDGNNVRGTPGLNHQHLIGSFLASTLILIVLALSLVKYPALLVPLRCISTAALFAWLWVACYKLTQQQTRKDV